MCCQDRLCDGVDNPFFIRFPSICTDEPKREFMLSGVETQRLINAAKKRREGLEIYLRLCALNGSDRFFSYEHKFSS